MTLSLPKHATAVDLDRRQLTIYRSDHAPVTLAEGDTLTCEVLLPGFSLALSDLFTY